MKQLKIIVKALFGALIWGSIIIILLILTGFAREYVLNREVPIVFQMVTILGLFLMWIGFGWGFLHTLLDLFKKSN
jgi:hypothetical protein